MNSEVSVWRSMTTARGWDAEAHVPLPHDSRLKLAKVTIFSLKMYRGCGRFEGSGLMVEVTAQFESHICIQKRTLTERHIQVIVFETPKWPCSQNSCESRGGPGPRQKSSSASSIVNLSGSGRRILYGLFVLFVIGSFTIVANTYH